MKKCENVKGFEKRLDKVANEKFEDFLNNERYNTKKLLKGLPFSYNIMEDWVRMIFLLGFMEGFSFNNDEIKERLKKRG